MSSSISNPSNNSNADFLTILECSPEHVCAKRYTDPAKPPAGYSESMKFFTPHVEAVASLADLRGVLDQIRTMPRVAVIRDRLCADAPKRPDGTVTRRRHGQDGEPGAFEDFPHRWVMLDADKTSTPFDASDRAGSVERWRAALPEGLRGAEVVFQFSAKQHLSPTVRGHGFFWLAEPLSSPQLKPWATRHGFDGAMFNAVQLHYVADPVFSGCADPLAPRDLVHLPGELAGLDLTPEERAATSTANASKSARVMLDDLPEPCGTAEAHAARASAVPRRSSHSLRSPDTAGIYARRWVARALKPAYPRRNAWRCWTCFGVVTSMTVKPPTACGGRSVRTHWTTRALQRGLAPSQR